MPSHPDRGADSPDYLSRRADPYVARGIKFPIPPSDKTPLGHGLGARHRGRPVPLSVVVAIALGVVLVIALALLQLTA
jgi:hypothetical protein